MGMFLNKFGLITAMLLVVGTIGNGAEPKDRPQGTTVTGRVVSEPGGKEAAGVEVTLWNGSNGQRTTSRTDDTGSYSFSNVEPGDYYKVWIQEWPKKELGIWSEAVVFRVKDELVRADDLCLKLPQSISGTVTDVDSGKPVPGVTINFSTADKNRDSVKTDSEGHYRLFVTPRDVDLECNGIGERYYGSDANKKVPVAPGNSVTEINFNVKEAPKYSGQVVYPDGSPAKGLDMLVRIQWSGNHRVTGDIDSAGIGKGFRLKTDEAGGFLGYMRRTIERDWEEKVAVKAISRLPDGTMGGVARAATNSKEYRIDPLKVVLAKSAGVKLRVVNPEGEPITHAKVTASDIYPGLYTKQGGPVTHEGEGKYLMTDLVPGLDYFFEIQATGYQQFSQRKEIVLKPEEVRDLGDIRLEWWGKKAVPGLIKKLQGADLRARESAARQLGELGVDAADAVPALIETFNQDPRNTNRGSAAVALGKIGPAAIQAVPDLIRALQDNKPFGPQSPAATALGLIGDPSALPFLRDALESKEFGVSKAAAESIKVLEKDLKAPAPAK